MGLAVAVVVACGALQAATPDTARSLPRVVAPASIVNQLLSPGATRETRRLARKARVAANSSPSVLANFGKSAGAGSAARVSSDTTLGLVSAPDSEPRFEPWSLLVALLSVMVFVARRRGAE